MGDPAPPALVYYKYMVGVTAFGREGSGSAAEIAVARLKPRDPAFGRTPLFGAPAPKRAQRFQLRSAPSAQSLTDVLARS